MGPMPPTRRRRRARPNLGRPRKPPAAVPSDEVESASPARARSSLMVVGVGASAGGLEAFSQLLAALPADLGMAVVLVQHLAPQHESALPVLLSGVSQLPVIHVSGGS